MAEVDTDEELRLLVEVLREMARQEQSAQASGGETRAALRTKADVVARVRMALELCLFEEASPIETAEAPDDLVPAEDVLWLRFSPEDPEDEDGGGG